MGVATIISVDWLLAFKLRILGRGVFSFKVFQDVECPKAVKYSILDDILHYL